MMMSDVRRQDKVSAPSINGIPVQQLGGTGPGIQMLLKFSGNTRDPTTESIMLPIHYIIRVITTMEY